MFGLLETKLKLDKVTSFMHRKFRGWDWCSNLEQVTGGRILIIWNPNLIECTPLSFSPQVIHCQVTDKVASKKFICSFVYSFNTVAERADLWNSLISWGVNNNEHWILLGDFNSTLNAEDRLSGIPIANSDMDAFVSCTTVLGLEDMFSIGKKFTWSNGTHWAKLDRVLHNSLWNSLNFTCQADFMDYNTLSDHTPALVNLSAQTLTKAKPFKFLNMWMSHPEFKDTVVENWSTPVYGTKQFRFCMKLKALKHALKTLNRQHFSHISERTKRAQDSYVAAQNMLLNDPSSHSLKDRVKETKKAVNFLLEAERQFFKQKLKNKHLIFGDRGTSYFHSMVKKKEFCCYNSCYYQK